MTNAEKLHKYFAALPRYSFPFNANEIYKNGIYIFFEKGEVYKSYDRIVRVGTHNGQNNLPARLKEHLVKENKDRSIFRKNIGRAILNRAKDSFLSMWNIDLTKPETRKKYSALIDFKKLQEIEKEVSDYMRKNFSFCVIPVETKNERLYFEERIISTLAHDADFKCSENWLGKFSPESEIIESGLWLKKGLKAQPLTNEEIELIVGK